MNLDDFSTYDSVYVLNPIEGRLSFDGLEGKTVESESDKYLFMLRNVPRPSTVEPLFVTENIEFFKLDGPPVGWFFADDGSWKAYSRQ